MEFYADLHIHSKYSRATAKSCDLEHLAGWARKKGIAVVGTGDFTHPGWRAELERGLVPAEAGTFRLNDELQAAVDAALPAACQGPVRFVLSVEISTIYKKGERTRKVHHVLYAPGFAEAGRITKALDKIGNLKSDGRPILGLDSRDLLEIVLESGPDSYLVPAHIWTPWFSALGSKSGFDSIAECYGDLADHIFAVETGLSSDPAMNWQVSSLDRYRLVSNSDAHSPPMLGREACIFDGDRDYVGIRHALQTGEGYVGTVEFYPEEGKYHLDGHRSCGVRLSPSETRELGGRCPQCGKLITVGVLSRVQDLADRAPGSPPLTAGQVRSLVPLCEILGELRGVGPKSKSVQRDYEALLGSLGPELDILASTPLEDVRRVGGEQLTEALSRLRRGQVFRDAGYDGEYGVIRLFERDELDPPPKSGLLFELPQPEPVRDAQGPAEARRALDPSPTALATDATLPLFAPSPAASAPDSLLSQLDGDQRAAARILIGPLLIIAGPGSGKTRTLTHRIAHLVDDYGTAPERCLAITFTRRAASEMKERLQTLLPDRWQGIVVSTFHQLGLSILREHSERLGLPADFRIAGQSDQLQLLQEDLDLSVSRARRLLSKLSRAKRTGGAEPAELAEPLAAYQAGLEARGLVDFDDLVGRAVAGLDAHPDLVAGYRDRWGWLSIDEYQDVDATQVRLVRHLAPPDGNVCAIGDPDQAIYGFRGADVAFFRQFQEDYPGAQVVRLTRNYRSGRGIVQGSGQIIGAASAPRRSPPEGDRAPSSEAMQQHADLITIHQAVSDRAEAEFVVHTLEQLLGGHSFFSVDSGRSDGAAPGQWSFSDFAVLYRTEAQADAICEALQRSGMPYQRRSHHRLSDLEAVRALVAQLGEAHGSVPVSQRLVAAASNLLHTAGADRDRAERSGQGDLEAPVDAETIDQALELLAPLAAQAGDDLPRFLAELALGAQVDTWDPRADRVALLTLHAAKGLEFPVVFIVGCEDGLLPLRFGELDEAQIEEERRLLYVGMTRAQRRLLLCHAQKRLWRGAVRPASPSPFLRDIAEQLLQHSATRAAPQRHDASEEQLKLF